MITQEQVHIIWSDGPSAEFKKQIHGEVHSITQLEVQKTFLMGILCHKPWEMSCWWNWWQSQGFTISNGIDWSLIKSELPGLCKNNIHITTYHDGYKVQAFKYSGGEKVAEFSYKIILQNSPPGGYILSTTILYI